MWKIKHSRIAAVVEATSPEGKVYDCIFLSKESGITVGVTDNGKRIFDSLPNNVKADVSNRFDQVFSLPVEHRQEFVNNSRQSSI